MSQQQRAIGVYMQGPFSDAPNTKKVVEQITLKQILL